MLPVPFYHCFGMVMGNLGATTHGACDRHPVGRVRPRRDAAGGAGERCTVLYGVPTMFIAELALADFASFDLSSLRTGIMAGSPCPVEVMKRVVAEMHMAEVTICLRHDGDLARVDADQARRRPRAPGVDRRHGAPARRGEDRRPRERAHAAARRAGRAVHPRLLGDARLLGRAREDRRRHRRGRLDAHRRPRDDGRRRLRQHRRPHQGHGHPRRRERLPARDRGVPLLPPRHRRRAGDRRAGREVRRGAVRVGPAARGRRAARRRRRCASSARDASRTTRCRATSRSSTSSR